MPSDFLDSEFTVIGKDGFVGSTLMRDLPNAIGYGSKDSHLAPSRPHGNVIVCAARGSKRLANIDPSKDALEISEILLTVSDLRRYKRIILISTIDVYGSKVSRKEFDIRDTETPYGENRRKLESELLDRFGDKLTIIRLPSVFGHGMKKNVLYDLLNGHNNGPINLLDSHQWYDMRMLAIDIVSVIRSNIREVNFFTRPLSNSVMIPSVFTRLKERNFIIDKETAKVYDHKTQWDASGYWMSKRNVISQLKDFVETYQSQ